MEQIDSNFLKSKPESMKLCKEKCNGTRNTQQHWTSDRMHEVTVTRPFTSHSTRAWEPTCLPATNLHLTFPLFSILLHFFYHFLSPASDYRLLSRVKQTQPHQFTHAHTHTRVRTHAHEKTYADSHTYKQACKYSITHSTKWQETLTH